MESGSRPRGGVRGIVEGVPSIGGEHLDAEGGFNFASVRHVPRSFYATMRRGHIQRGDVLVVKDGATTGKVSIVRDDFPFPEAVVNEHVFVCRPKSISSDYLFWFLHSAEGQRRILDHFRGSAQGGITQEFARGTAIPVPTNDIQDQIAGVLNAAEAQRKSVNRRITRARARLKLFRQALLTAGCSGELTAGWRTSHPLSPISEVMRQRRSAADRQSRRVAPPAVEDEGSIPRTWARAALGEVADVQLGGTPSRNQSSYWGGGVPWVSSGEVANCRIATTRETVSQEGLSNSSAKLYPAGTVLIAMIGEGKTRGQSAILDIAAATNQNVAGLLADESVVRPEYLWRWALAQYEVTRAVGRGGNQPALNGQKVRELLIPIPQLEEQDEVIRRIDELLSLAGAVETKVDAAGRKTERVASAILGQAFRGELVLIGLADR